ncbi:HNH endonuclease [Candidatus Woesearchaeota archaeon]|nr:HNH endonuclease [Candidatus Woesearchaeota archaeon]
MCGRGKADGVEIQADHIKPRYLGGKSIIENGQVLCAQHNFIKKTLNQTETGKKMFINLYELAKIERNEEIINFCAEILETYERHGINGHIIWKR